MVEIDLGIDFRQRRKLQLFLGRGELDRADVAGRPGGTEQISAAGVQLRQLDVEEAVAATAAFRSGRP